MCLKHVLTETKSLYINEHSVSRPAEVLHRGFLWHRDADRLHIDRHAGEITGVFVSLRVLGSPSNGPVCFKVLKSRSWHVCCCWFSSWNQNQTRVQQLPENQSQFIHQSYYSIPNFCCGSTFFIVFQGNEEVLEIYKSLSLLIQTHF